MHLVIAVVKRVPSGLDGKRLGEPSGDRTRDPLIKSYLPSIPTEVHDDVRLEDL